MDKRALCVLILLGGLYTSGVFVDTLCAQTHGMTDPYTLVYGLGAQACKAASQRFSDWKKGSVLAVTNAGYVQIDGKDSAPVIDALTDKAGASLGRGNLLLVHEASDKPLFVFFYHARSGAALYLERRKDATGGTTPLGAQNAYEETFQRDFASYLKDPTLLESRMNESFFGGQGMRLVLFSWLWSQNANPEIRTAALFHDHLCPGVVSGYYVSRYLRRHLPLGSGQSYSVLSTPMYCKDDAIQTLLNVTPGKRSLAAIPMNAQDKECLLEHARDAVGLFFRWDQNTKMATGLVLGFDWKKLERDAGLAPEEKRRTLADRVKLLQWMVEHQDNDEKYVRVIKEITLEEGTTPQDLARPGVNPWVRCGLWKCGT